MKKHRATSDEILEWRNRDSKRRIRLRISLILDREQNLLFNEEIDEGQIDRVLRFVERLRPAATSSKRATADASFPERHEFLSMIVDAALSKTAEHSKWKTDFIQRLLETDVDSATMAKLRRALDPQSRWLSRSRPRL